MANSGTFKGRARVAVVDNDEQTRQCVSDILQLGKNFAFAGGFSSGKEALTAIPRLRPDLALEE
jgi:DNA-binding NarL/FixJ family response regulator